MRLDYSYSFLRPIWRNQWLIPFIYFILFSDRKISNYENYPSYSSDRAENPSQYVLFNLDEGQKTEQLMTEA